MDDIRIVRAADTDVETVASILQEAATWLNQRGTPLWRADELTPATIREEVRTGMFWFARVEGTPAGCVRFQLEDLLFWPDIPAGESAFIHRLAVRREFAGGRVSAALIDWAKQRAKKLGLRFLRLDCEAEAMKLRGIYERSGFRKHSERRVGPYLVARYEFRLDGGHQADAAQGMGPRSGPPRTE